MIGSINNIFAAITDWNLYGEVYVTKEIANEFNEILIQEDILFQKEVIKENQIKFVLID